MSLRKDRLDKETEMKGKRGPQIIKSKNEE